ASLAERLRAASGASGTTKLGKEFLDVDWSAASRTGDSERGRKLFSADGIGCVKCHAIRPEMAVQGGPSLVGAGKRFTVPYLVESILLPSKHVSPVFQSTLIVTTNGKTYTGLVLNETAEKIELMLLDAKRQTIPKDEIEVRKIQKISPMPHGIVKNPDELRDLLAYLLRN
ncbi:MAG: c-type cytochrome, partial [Planctomycetes bacterium]|nr:c-type cytochrome [Planctomycetota bacterium]